MIQLFLSDGRLLELAHAEPKEPFMIWSDLNADFDLLSLCVRLGDETVRVLARVDVQWVLTMISVSTHAAFSIVLTTLDVKPSAVQLVIRELFRTIGKNSPCGVSAGGFRQLTMTEYKGNQARNHGKTKDFFGSHFFQADL